jgi:tetratricopeptide (TPR) repeat protein
MNTQWTHSAIVRIALAMLCVALSAAEAKPAQPRNEVAFYIEAYGEVVPERDDKVALAHQVFERVCAVADKNSSRLPKLIVVNSRGDPWAIALPDGHIVLSKQAVDICYLLPTVTEACLAFVLGHELAHLAHDDFWHYEVHTFLATHAGTHSIAEYLETQRSAKTRELAADDKGFIYAAIAGYPVSSLLANRARKSRFFEFWMQQTNTRVQALHASAEDRAALLERRLQDIQSKLAFFNFGVRLSHFDYCDDGVYFLREFQKVFPGREVLNNLGYCYLQLARREMRPEQAFFYWLPLILDGETQATGLGQRGGIPLKSLKQAASGQSEGFLQEAIAYLKPAIEADPHYVPARINLAVAELYLGKPYQARAVLEETRQFAPHNLNIQVLKALTLYEQSDASLDLWPVAVKQLEKLASGPDTPPFLLFNLARLLDARPRPAEARVYWNRLASTAESLPLPIRDIVCRKQSKATLIQSCHNSANGSAQPPQPLPWSWPVSVSGLERLAPEVERNTLRDWDATYFDWFKGKLHGHIYRRRDKKAEVLELDQFIQMQVLKGNRLAKVQDLASYCSQPLRQRSLAQGVVRSCDGWAALSTGNEVKELWWIAK